MKLNIKFIQPAQHRYATVGDWFLSRGIWWLHVTRTKDKRHMWLVLFHEFIEWGLCQLWGIRQREVDKFDKAYEGARCLNTLHLPSPLNAHSGECNHRAPCGCPINDDPGDDIHAPYHDAHAVASECERLIARALGVDWLDYEAAIEAL